MYVVTVPERYRRTDRQTDRRLTVASPRSALASRANEWSQTTVFTALSHYIFRTFVSNKSKARIIVMYGNL